MNSIYKQVRLLYEKELYSNVVKLCNLALTHSEQNADSSNGQNKLQIMKYYADSLYKTEHYQKAEQYYRQCITLRKNIVKNKSSKSSEKYNDIPSEADIKYRIHLCLISLKNNNEALEILQSIQSKHRDAKINMALGNLLKENGMERLAILAYKDVLEELPLSLEAAENLLKLGMKGIDVNSLTVEATSEHVWIGTWLKAQAQLYSRDFKNAIETFKQMDVQGVLQDNTYLLVSMGYCYHYMCEDKKAIEVLQRAFMLDNNLVYGLGLLSNILADAEDDSNSDLMETITPKAEVMNTWSNENWIVFSNYMYTLQHYERAAYFAHQAILLSSKSNIEALIVKARSFFKLGKYQETATICTEAMQLCSYRFPIHKCLVETYLKMNRMREADTMALNACKQLNNSPHALKLHARVLLKDPVNNCKNIKKVLEKAITLDKEASSSAVIMLVLFLEQECQFLQANQLILKQIEKNPSSRLYQLLGDSYVNLGKDSEAFDCYNTALRLDPNNQRALEGLDLIGPSAKNMNNSRERFYTCLDDSSCPSQNTLTLTPDLDGESDSDLWPNNTEMHSF